MSVIAVWYYPGYLETCLRGSSVYKKVTGWSKQLQTDFAYLYWQHALRQVYNERPLNLKL